jgi:hypothetical protein
MGHPAGQLADRLHLLHLAQLHFQQAPLGHVRDADHLTRRVAHRI